jgi:hypothetical protein
VFGLWVYDKAREDYLEVENEQGMQMLTDVGPISPFTISSDEISSQSQQGRIPINTNGFHLFFAGEEFVYSTIRGLRRSSTCVMVRTTILEVEYPGRN